MSSFIVRMTIHLTELVSKLREIFEEDYVDVDEVTKLLQSYKSNRADWSKFAIFDINKFVTSEFWRTWNSGKLAEVWYGGSVSWLLGPGFYTRPGKTNPNREGWDM